MSVQDTQFPSLGQEDPLEKERATHSSILYMGLSRQEYLPPSHLDGHPLQYSCLENPMDGGAWRAAVHGVTESRA